MTKHILFLSDTNDAVVFTAFTFGDDHFYFLEKSFVQLPPTNPIYHCLLVINY